MGEDAQPKQQAGQGWWNLAVDFGPVLVFFVSYRFLSPSGSNNPVAEALAIAKSTGAFMLAAVAALTFSRWRLGRVSPMLMLSTLLIVGFGGLTILLRDPIWIQLKPTAIYVLFAALLLGGLMRGHALLKYLLEAAFEGLDDTGWMKLSRNWGLFFLFLAALNEVLRRVYNVENGNFGTWIALKLWLFMPLSFLFTFTQLPMLMRHGLLRDAQDEVIADPPHE